MPDFEFLIGKAAQIVSEQYADAKLCHVRGLPKKPASVAADFTQLAFAFMRAKGYVTIVWDNERFGPPSDHGGLWMGDQPINPPLQKTLDQALGILRDGGYKDPIAQLDLRKPLHPGVTEPLYVFAFGDPVTKVIGVGANTGTLNVEG